MKMRLCCIYCGTTETSMCHASDPWCGDTHHKAVAQDFNVTQKQLTSTVFWLVMDMVLETHKNPRFDTLRKAFSEYFNAEFITKETFTSFGLSPEDLFKRSKKPVDWAARAVLIQKGPWGITVPELSVAHN